MPDINTSGGLPPVQPGAEPGQAAPVDATAATPSPDGGPPPVASGQAPPQQTHAPALAPPQPTTEQDLEQSTEMLYASSPAEAFNPDVIAQIAAQQSQEAYDNAQNQREDALQDQLNALSDVSKDIRSAATAAEVGAIVMGSLSIAAGAMSGIGTIGAGGDTEMELSQGKVQMARWSSFGDASKGLGTIGQGIAQKVNSDWQSDQTADQKIADKASDRHDAASQAMSKAESIRESLISVVQKIADAQSEAASTAARNV